MALATNSSSLQVTPEWSAKCYAFFEYWRSRRDGRLLPSTESVLDAMPPQFVNTIYIVEITAGQSRVRFQGAELITTWAVDRTGEDIAQDHSPKLQAQIYAINRLIVDHPCGYLSQSTYTSSRGRMVDVAVIRLPLAVKEGRWPRIIACLDENDSLKDGERAWEKYDLMDHAWVDIGAGIPNQPPSQIIQ